MRVFEKYTDDIFVDYIDSLQVGDEVLVKRNGHEFIKCLIEDVNGDIVTEEYVFDDDGADERNGAEIMLPTTKTMHQWKVCEERKLLTDRFMAACEAYEPDEMSLDDLGTLIPGLVKCADYSELQEINEDDLHTVLEVFIDIVDPSKVVTTNFTDLNILTKILESACPSLNRK